MKHTTIYRLFFVYNRLLKIKAKIFRSTNLFVLLHFRKIISDIIKKIVLIKYNFRLKQINFNIYFIETNFLRKSTNRRLSISLNMFETIDFHIS